MTHSRPWLALASHYREIAHLSMRDLFSQDPLRFQNFSLQCCDILLDYSKNRITKETLQLLIQLAEQSDLRNWMERMFGGEKVNGTEDRAALHTALRNRASTPVYVNGKDVMPDVNQVLEKIRRFSNGIRQGSWLGYTGKPMSDVVNIGIGGSDLGPAMVTSALRPYCGNPRVHFVSNVDGAHLATTLEALSPETTLFVVASKTFTTQETLLNAHSARQWFLSQAISPSHVAKHFVAISTNRNEVVKFGIDSEHIFEFWDWVGGRYSLWSAIGLPIAIAIGMEHFDELLQGAHDMDKHFQYAPFDKNMPVILGLLGIWYTNFFGAQNQAVLPYDQNMQHFVAYLQQMLMESTGKTVTRNGLPVGCDTGPVIWGGVGTNGQHAFYQLIHQGTPLIPADFVAPIESHYSLEGHHTILLSHFIAQTEALMNGRTASETHAEMVQSGLSDEVIERLLPHRVFSGNKPTNTLLLKKLTPRALGSLLALYEHRTFVQSVIWDINAFDQWGVELGKQLAYRIQSELTGNTPAGCHDSSTQGLIEICRKHRS